MRVVRLEDGETIHNAFIDRAGVETREIADGLNADVGADGGIVGFDIDGASRKLDLSTLDTGTLPLRAAP